MAWLIEVIRDLIGEDTAGSELGHEVSDEGEMIGQLTQQRRGGESGEG